MHSHPLCRTRFGQYQSSLAALGMRTAVSCTKCSQVASCIQKVGKNSLKASSVHVTVLCAAIYICMHMQLDALRLLLGHFGTEAEP